MNYVEYLQAYDNFDKYLLFLDEIGIRPDDISAATGVTRATLYNARKRNETLLKAIQTIESESEYGNSSVNQIIDAFKDKFGNTKTTKFDRFAAHRMATKYTPEVIVNAITLLADHSEDKFAPTANSVRQFEEKLPGIIKFLRTKNNNGKLIDL